LKRKRQKNFAGSLTLAARNLRGTFEKLDVLLQVLMMGKLTEMAEKLCRILTSEALHSIVVGHPLMLGLV
jgi:hypothetical protein